MFPIPILTSLQKNALYALLALCMILLIAGFSYLKGRYHENLEWKAKEAQVLQSQLAEIQRQRDENAKLVAEYQKVERERNIYYRKLKDEVAKNTSGTQCFGAGAVRVWNEAIGSTRDLPRATTGTAKAPAATSGATDTEVLSNHVTNMQQYAECRDLHQKIIEWHDKNFSK